MKKMTLAVAGILAMVPLSVHGQRAVTTDSPANWASLKVLMYTGISSLRAFGIGASLQRRIGGSLMVGIDGSFARSDYEREDIDTETVVGSGTASIATAMAVGRYGYSGGGNIGFYLTGGVGTIAYRLEDLDSWNADFALQAGTGLEYRFARNKAIALEWGRMWGYHEEEGVGGGTQKHSRLQLAFRYAF